MCIWLVVGVGDGGYAGALRLLIAGCPAATLYFLFPGGQPNEEVADFLLNLFLGPQAQVSGGFLSRPAPDRLIGVEVRAVARQVHQPQPQARRPQIFTHRLAPVRRCVVPNHVERPSVPLPQPVQEGSRGSGVAVPLLLSLSKYPANPPRPSPGIPPSSSWPFRRSAGCSSPPRLAPPQHPLAPQLGVRTEVGLVGEEYLGPGPPGLLRHGGVFRHERFPFLRISLEQPFLGRLKANPKPCR